MIVPVTVTVLVPSLSAVTFVVEPRVSVPLATLSVTCTVLLGEAVARTAGPAEVYIDGSIKVMDQPEFADPERLRELLRGAGLDFNKHQTEGIAIGDFGELLTTSGLLVDKRVTWITFHR